MNTRRQPFHIQLLDLTLIQLTNWRWSWRMTIITGMIAPLFSTLAIGAFASRGGEDKLYILSGNIVLSLLFVSMGNVSGHFVFMRFTGRLDFFATLPIYRTTLIIATVIAFFLLNLPTVLATLIAGVLILDVPLHLHPATYAAAALRQTLFNHPETLPLSLNITILTTITLALLWLVNHKMDWRGQ